MLIHIDTNRGIPYYRQVKEQITQMILSGQLEPGTKLESVAKLSKRLKVNPMTISKAYSFLVEEKVLERRPGIGVFVAQLAKDHQDAMTISLLEQTLKKAGVLAMQLGMDQTQILDIFTQILEKIKANEKGQNNGV